MAYPVDKHAVVLALDRIKMRGDETWYDYYRKALDAISKLPPVDIREQTVDIGYLYEWYQDSVDPDDEPVWTKKHIEEIFHDFYLIPKQDGEKA